MYYLSPQEPPSKKRKVDEEANGDEESGDEEEEEDEEDEDEEDEDDEGILFLNALSFFIN